MAKKKSKQGKGTYAAYAADNRATKNRAKRIARHLKNHPNDAQTAKFAGRVKPQKVASKHKTGQKPAGINLRNEAGHAIVMPEFEVFTKPRK